VILKGVKAAEPAALQKQVDDLCARLSASLVCQNRIQRCGNLYGDEFPDDGCAAFDAHARYFSAGVQFGNPVACYCHVRSGIFTGKLINRFGAMRIAAAGLLITACSVLAGLSGTDVFHWLSLILLGLGWNFGFTGASAKIIEYHRPEEKTRYSP
jgi:MFS family permease